MSNLCRFLASWMSSWLGSAGAPTFLSKFIQFAWASDKCPYCAILRGVLFGIGLAVSTHGGFLIIFGVLCMLCSFLLTRVERSAECGVRT